MDPLGDMAVALIVVVTSGNTSETWREVINSVNTIRAWGLVIHSENTIGTG